MAHACMLLIFIFTCLIYGYTDSADQPPLVKTFQGSIRGSILTTYTGNKIYSFRGVRYAEPATGENRFKPPIPLKPWSGTYDATKDGAACPQPHPERLGGNVSEDCLFINIYTKQLTGNQSVIVFFHPGGFIYLTGRSDWFGPQYILNKDIVLVTTNNRLGPTGFLSTDDKVLRGNYGLKDQVAVLRWVNLNIAGFGGNPDDVTIMGCSIGASSVLLHMLSPMSRGLFHKAIAMSGSATAPWAVNKDPLYLAKELTRRVGCGEANMSQQIYNCVKSKCPFHMAFTADRINLWKVEPPVVLAAVVEKDYGDGEERFLTDEPLELIKRGDIAPVPLIIGTTADEFTSMPYFYNESLLQEFNEDFDEVAPRVFMYERNTSHSQSISERLRKFYLNNQPITNDTLLEFGKIFSDSIVIFPVMQAAKLLAEKSRQPVYMYLFSYVGRYSWKYIPDTNTPIGSLHMDDLMYLFYISRRFPEFNETDPENDIIDILTSTWTDFAKTGVPTLPQSNIKWAPLTSQSLQYLDISVDPKMVSGVPFPKRMDLWESMFPVSGPHQIYY